jgi:hypothetical protein
MDKVNIHKKICEELNAIYEIKNERYNDSFGDSFKEYGLLNTRIRLDDKMKRFKSLSTNKKLDNQSDETIEDTLKDLANYCIMTIIELRGGTE